VKKDDSSPAEGERGPVEVDLVADAQALIEHLAVWATRDDTKAQPEVRHIANTAMDIIDRLLADLHTARERLLLEIRHSDDATNARIDALLASIRTGA
jgi:hypothetical protein